MSNPKQPRRYDGRCGVKERNHPIWMDIMQAHCNEFFRRHGMPVTEFEYKSRRAKP